MATHYNGKVLPFRICFVYSNGNEVEIEKVWKPEKLWSFEQFVTINENWSTGIQFFVENEADFDDKAYLKIQTSLFDEEDTQKVLKYPLTKEPTIQWIYSEQESESENYPWRMGAYLIDIYYNSEKYTTGFMVHPTHLSREQVEKIHSYLEEKIEGIIYDFIYSNLTFSRVLSDDFSSQWYYDYARYMKENKEKIIYCLSLIEKYPSTKIVGNYKLSPLIGKQDRKSIQWALTKSKTQFFNKIKQENIETSANEWMKHILESWKMEIHDVTLIIQQKQLRLQEDLLKLKADFLQLEERLSQLEQKQNAARSHIIDTKNLLKKIENDIKQKEQIDKQHHQWLHCLNLLESNIGYSLTQGFLSQVKRGYIRPLLKRNPYYLLDLMYEETKKIKQEKGEKKRLIKILKPTWLIYEYFCLFQTLDVLKELGFSIIEGFSPQMIDLYYENKIPEGSRFVLENEKAVIYVWYDKHHAHTAEEAKKKGEYFYTHMVKKRPDIKLDIFKKEKNQKLLFKDSVVIDAKFRRLQSLYTSEYMNKTYEQLISYNTFFYRGENRMFKSRGSIVNRVICLYGSEAGSEIKSIKEPITFIKLFPIIDGEIIHITGKNELKEELLEWIDELI
jgi:hypothetical protein